MAIMHPRDVETSAFAVLKSIDKRNGDYGLPIRELLTSDLRVYKEIAKIVCNGVEETYPDLEKHDPARLRALSELREKWVDAGVKQLLDRFPNYKPPFKSNESR